MGYGSNRVHSVNLDKLIHYPALILSKMREIEDISYYFLNNTSFSFVNFTQNLLKKRQYEHSIETFIGKGIRGWQREADS